MNLKKTAIATSSVVERLFSLDCARPDLYSFKIQMKPNNIKGVLNYSQIKFLPSIFFVFFALLSFSANAQDSLAAKAASFSALDTIQREYDPYNPIDPSKAAFYSAVLPGLGQFYNESYWKIPLVYGALGTTIYFYIQNNQQYHRYRKAYKRRLAGFEDEFAGVLSKDALISAQRTYRRNKQIFVLLTVAAYVLNIVDASVDAHLQQFNVDDDLSLKPNFQFNQISGRTSYGLSLNFKF